MIRLLSLAVAGLRPAASTAACRIPAISRQNSRPWPPAVGVLVLAGNIVRNSLLVAIEGAGQPLAPWAHDALGLLLLALVCGGIAQVRGVRRADKA